MLGITGVCMQPGTSGAELGIQEMDILRVDRRVANVEGVLCMQPTSRSLTSLAQYCTREILGNCMIIQQRSNSGPQAPKPLRFKKGPITNSIQSRRQRKSPKSTHYGCLQTAWHVSIIQYALQNQDLLVTLERRTVPEDTEEASHFKCN